MNVNTSRHDEVHDVYVKKIARREIVMMACSRILNLRISLSNRMTRKPRAYRGARRGTEKSLSFQIHRTSVDGEGGMETEITKRVGAGWRNGNKCSG